jgi:hypothetical protein
MTEQHQRDFHRRAAIALLVVAATTAGLALEAPASSRKGWFTPRCADHDIRALAVIEEFGDSDGMPAEWLANAGLNFLQARLYCLSNAEVRGIALYERIIAGDARLSRELTAK